MQGYFLVKPSSPKALEQVLYKQHLNKDAQNFFNFIKGDVRL